MGTFTPLCLNFLICKTEIIMIIIATPFVRITWINTCNILRTEYINYLRVTFEIVIILLG